MRIHESLDSNLLSRKQSSWAQVTLQAPSLRRLYYHKKYLLLTCSEGMVPPIGFTQISLQVVSGASHDHDGRRHQGANHQEYCEHGNDDSQSFQEIHVRYFHGLCGAHTEYHRYPTTGALARFPQSVSELTSKF